MKTLGYFAEECDAAQAYNFVAEELYGEFARFNLPLSEAALSSVPPATTSKFKAWEACAKAEYAEGLYDSVPPVEPVKDRSTSGPQCSSCGGPVEFIKSEQVWRHVEGQGPVVCDRYGYPVAPKLPEGFLGV